MKTFKCNCTEQLILFFESSHCLACGRTVGIDDEFDQVEPYEIDEQSGLFYKAEAPEVFYKKCDTKNSCTISEQSGKIVNELKKEILKRAANYEKQTKDKKFKPYRGYDPTAK